MQNIFPSQRSTSSSSYLMINIYLVNLFLQNVLPCSYNGSCEVKKETRRYCTACRLAKCFLVGMSSDFIRKEERKSTKLSSSSESRSDTLVTNNRMVVCIRLSRDMSKNYSVRFLDMSEAERVYRC